MAKPPTKTRSEKTTTKKAPVKKTAAKKAAVKPKVATRHISADDRRQMIAEAAYLQGETQGFRSDEQVDWLQAEANVDALLSKAKINVRD